MSPSASLSLSSTRRRGNQLQIRRPPSFTCSSRPTRRGAPWYHRPTPPRASPRGGDLLLWGLSSTAYLRSSTVLDLAPKPFQRASNEVDGGDSTQPCPPPADQVQVETALVMVTTDDMVNTVWGSWVPRKRRRDHRRGQRRRGRWRSHVLSRNLVGRRDGAPCLGQRRVQRPDRRGIHRRVP